LPRDPTHERLQHWPLDEKDHEHGHERRQEQRRTESDLVSALEIEDAFELALVRIGLVAERSTLEERALGWAALGRTDREHRILDARRARVPGRINSPRARPQGHDGVTVHLHQGIDLREAPAIDRRLTGRGAGAAPPPVQNNLDLLVRAHRRLERCDELPGQKGITRDDAQAAPGRRILGRRFEITQPDWIATLLSHWSPFPGVQHLATKMPAPSFGD
jgi:hypothetical protein